MKERIINECEEKQDDEYERFKRFYPIKKKPARLEAYVNDDGSLEFHICAENFTVLNSLMNSIKLVKDKL